MSATLWDRQSQAISQGCLTNSKHPKTHILGVAPTHIRKAQGARFTDDGGKVYVDFVMGLGSCLFGYAQDTINRRVYHAMQMGYSHSLSTHYEVMAAERLKGVFTFIDRIKFTKTGSSACTMALKIARAVTDRRKVLSEGYHGDHDEFCDVYNGKAGESVGIYALDIDLSNINTDVAAVIVEPVMTSMSRERLDWLQQLRFKCSQMGVVLIFDEIITGLRVPMFSVSKMWNITPDLICFGKAMANGLPIAGVGGSAAIMDSPKFFASTTYAGEVLSLAAADCSAELVLSKKMDVDRLWTYGKEWLDRFNVLASGYVAIVGYPTRGVLVGSEENKALFRQEACKAGLFFGPSWFISFAHIDNAIEDITFNALSGVFARLHAGRASLEGPMPAAPQAQKVRGK